jgi:hypothetical protein
MSTFDRVLDGVKQVLMATEEIRRLSESVTSLAIEVREIDRRLVRIETLADLAAPRAGQQRRRLSKKE